MKKLSKTLTGCALAVSLLATPLLFTGCGNNSSQGGNNPVQEPVSATYMTKTELTTALTEYKTALTDYKTYISLADSDINGSATVTAPTETTSELGLSYSNYAATSGSSTAKDQLKNIAFSVEGSMDILTSLLPLDDFNVNYYYIEDISAAQNIEKANLHYILKSFSDKIEFDLMIEAISSSEDGSTASYSSRQFQRFTFNINSNKQIISSETIILNYGLNLNESSTGSGVFARPETQYNYNYSKVYLPVNNQTHMITVDSQFSGSYRIQDIDTFKGVYYNSNSTGNALRVNDFILQNTLLLIPGQFNQAFEVENIIRDLALLSPLMF